MFLIRALLVTQTIRFEAVAQHSLRLPAGSLARLGSRGPGVDAGALVTESNRLRCVGSRSSQWQNRRAACPAYVADKIRPAAEPACNACADLVFCIELQCGPL